MGSLMFSQTHDGRSNMASLRWHVPLACKDFPTNGVYHPQKARLSNTAMIKITVAEISI